jgi:hypothetical protein
MCIPPTSGGCEVCDVKGKGKRRGRKRETRKDSKTEREEDSIGSRLRYSLEHEGIIDKTEPAFGLERR